MRYRIHIGKVAYLSLTFAGAVLGPHHAGAYSYGPETQAEWDGWPEYCKARFTQSLIGSSSEYGRDVAPAVVERWKADTGLCWRYLHHHCAAILQLSRAKAAKNPQDRKFALESAIGEDKLAARYCPAENPFSANIASHTAMSFVEAGDYNKATQSTDWIIKTHPTYPGSYLIKASLFKRGGKSSVARDVLLEGDKATNGSSAEIHNALGYSYLATKDYEKAREHAKLAYGLGFPLPGLRDQLAKAGHPL